MVRVAKIMVLLGLLALCGSAWAMEGSGTQEDPYVITNAEELQDMQNDLGACYVLGNDIDACDTQTWNGGAGFEPVGSDPIGFTGKFDGQGHTIAGLYINRPSDGRIGLFGYITAGAEIKNAGLIDVDITAYGGSGSLVGASNGSSILRCWSTGTVRGTSSIQAPLGGLIGGNINGSLMSQCFSLVDVYAVSSGSPANRTGGLVGLNNKGSIIIDCYARGDVSAKNKVGGLVGDNTWVSYGGYIKRCYSVGKVTGSGGGLVGCNWMGGVTYDSYWDRETSGKSTSHGGTRKTTVQMMQQATFVNWDFVGESDDGTEDIWTIVEGSDYPRLWWENTAPIACIVGGDQTVEVGSGCEARVTLDGSCSSDADSTPETNDDINDFDWYEVIDVCDPNSDVFLGSGEIVECNLPLGEHTIILEVIDKADAFDANEVIITVEDTTPPEFSLTVTPDVLWPPNHKMVKITPSWEVSDNCDELPEVTLVDITVNGDGATEDDIQISDEGIWLRAERSRRRTGRVYTITYQAVDDSGNVAVQNATVTVPHNRTPPRLRRISRGGLRHMQLRRLRHMLLRRLRGRVRRRR
ncbi:MAG: GLUG motif-containing protein [Planctomycetota bacterium]|jgi:hypothetical protein